MKNIYRESLKSIRASEDSKQKTIKKFIRLNNEKKESKIMENKTKTKRIKLWAWLTPVTACLVAGIICMAVILPGLLNKENGKTLAISPAESRYSAKLDDNEDDRIKYMYSYSGVEEGAEYEYDIYYIYLGQLQNVPLCYKGQMYHGGYNQRYSFTTTKESMQNIGESIAEGSATARGIVEENTVSSTTGKKIGTEIGVTIGAEVEVDAVFAKAKTSVETSVKASAEASFEHTISDTTSHSFEKTTSLEKTISRATTFAQGEQETYEYNLTKEDPAGYYRLSLFMVSDVYLYLIRDSEGRAIYYEFKECLIPNSLTWKLDYSEDFFSKENNTEFKIDSVDVENLPKPEVHLGSSPENIDTLFKNPDYTSLTELKNNIMSTSKNVLTVSLKEANENSNNVIDIPKNIMVLNIDGGGHTLSNVRFEVAVRTTKLTLNLKNFNFTAPATYNAINASCDLELNIMGSCSITGGAGNNSSSTRQGKVGIVANNLKITGLTLIARLNVTGGRGVDGSGVDTYYDPNGPSYNTRGQYGADGNYGIKCANLITDIYELKVTGGSGGNGAVGSYQGQNYAGGYGGNGAWGIVCDSLVNLNLEEAIIVTGGNGGNGGKGGTGCYGGRGGYADGAVNVSISGLIDAKSGIPGVNGANG